MVLSQLPHGRSARAVAWTALAALLTVTTWLPAEALARRRGGKATRAASPAQVIVMSLTVGAEIYIDDVKVGVVPFEDPVDVAPGVAHTLRVQKRGFAPFVETFTLTAGAEREIEADLVPSGGVLRIQCNVLRAQVLLDGKPIGRTPFDGDIPPGKHTLEVVSAGYLRDAQPIEVKPGAELALDVKLAPVPPPRVEKDDTVLGKWWFWTAIGAAVVGGVTAGVLATRVDEVAPADPDRTLVIP
jgi:hypothetical protein